MPERYVKTTWGGLKRGDYVHYEGEIHKLVNFSLSDDNVTDVCWEFDNGKKVTVRMKAHVMKLDTSSPKEVEFKEWDIDSSCMSIMTDGHLKVTVTREGLKKALNDIGYFEIVR